VKSFFEYFEKKKIPRFRVILHILLTLATAGIWLFAAILIEIYVASSRENKVWRAKKSHEHKVENLKFKIASNKETIEDLREVESRLKESAASSFSIPFELPTVWLWESREQVTSVTSGTTLGKTRTGSVGLGWSDGIGWAASQGVTRGTIAAQTTEMITNDFMQLDSGILRIDKNFVAFIGNQFTRTGHYKDILSINTDYDKAIGLSILNAERIWLTRFPAEFEKRIALSLIKFAFTKSTSSGTGTIEEILQEFQTNIQNLEDEIRTMETEIESLIADNRNIGPV